MPYSCENCPVLCSMKKSATMKAPFCSYLKSRKNKLVIENICGFPLINECSAYAGLLGLLGTGLSLFDIIRVIKCGSVLPCSLWRSRIQAGKIVSVKCERDLKLISLVFSLEYYLLLLFGTVTQNPVLFLPWLTLYAFIISTEFIVFICRLFSEGFNVSKHGLLLTMFIIYNWLCIFCHYFHMMKA